MKKIKIIRKYGQFQVGQIVEVDYKTSTFLLMNCVACLYIEPKKSGCSDDCDDCDDCNGKNKKRVVVQSNLETESKTTQRKKRTTKKPDQTF
jgi:hypothetical protein